LKLTQLAKEYAIKVTQCKNLQDSILKIDQNLLKNETALLSPAASSLDEFSSYAERGNIFKEAIKTLS